MGFNPITHGNRYLRDAVIDCMDAEDLYRRIKQGEIPAYEGTNLHWALDAEIMFILKYKDELW